MTDAAAPLIVRTDDGVELAVWRAAPAAGTTPRRTPVVLVHGTFSNRNFFHGHGDRGLAHALAARGWDAWVPELRGHGRSRTLGHEGDWTFEDWIRLDAPALVRGVTEHTGAERVVWIGHSAGGVIGAAWLGLGGPAAGRVAGLVVAGAPAPIGLTLAQRAIAVAASVLARVAGRLPARALGIGPEDEQTGIFIQWMRWNIGRRWLGRDGTDYFAGLRNVRAAVLALAGAGDHLISTPAMCRGLVDAIGSDDKTFLVCGRRTGFRENYDHNRVLVSRAAREDVWPKIIDWMEQRFP